MTRRFRAWLGLNAFLWTIVPCATLRNMPVDTAELLYWARRPAFGYPKHPPMTYWVAGFFDRLAFGQIWGQYVAAQVCLALAFWGVWKLACRFLDEGAALLATVSLGLIYYYGFMGPEFNHNIVILPFWAWTAYFFWRSATSGGRKHWIAGGLLAGAGCLVKYSFLALLLPIALFFLFHPPMKEKHRQPGPYLALAAAALAFSPHLVWLLAGGRSTIAHAAGRLSSEGGLAARLHHFFEFAGVQLLAVLPLALVVWFSVRKAPKLPVTTKLSAGRYLFTIALAPFLVLAAACLVFGVRMRVNMYGAPLWLFAGIAVLYFSKRKAGMEEGRRFARAFLPLYLFWLSAFAFQYAALPYFRHIAKRGQFPGKEISARIHESWKKEFGTELPAVAGDPWAAGNVSVHSRTNPPVYTDVGNEFEDIRAAREKLKETGVVIVWETRKMGENYPDRYREIFPEAEVRPALEAAWLTRASVPPARVGWAIVMPQKSQNTVEA